MHGFGAAIMYFGLVAIWLVLPVLFFREHTKSGRARLATYSIVGTPFFVPVVSNLCFAAFGTPQEPWFTQGDWWVLAVYFGGSIALLGLSGRLAEWLARKSLGR